MIGMIAIAIGVFLSLILAYLGIDGETRTAVDRRLKAIKARNSNTRPSLEGELRKLALARTKPRETMFARLVPNRVALQDRLNRTGLSVSAEHYAGASLALFLVLVIVLALVGARPILALVVGLALALAVPHMVIGFLIKRRIQQFVEGFPVAIDLMARGIKSGLPISQTIEVIAAELEGPVQEEFQLVSDAIKIGRTLDEGLNQVSARIGLPEFQFFCISISVQRETGGNIGETLSNLSDVLRKRAQMKLKVKAISSEARTSSSFMAALPVMIVGAIHVMNPDYLEPFIKDEKLMHVGIGAFIWMMIGVGILLKMANLKV